MTLTLTQARSLTLTLTLTLAPTLPLILTLTLAPTPTLPPSQVLAAGRQLRSEDVKAKAAVLEVIDSGLTPPLK